MSQRRGRWTLVLVGLVALVAAGCAGGGSPSETDGVATGDGDVVTIRMEDNRFERETVRIGVGDTIRFDNVGVVPHNALDVDGAWSTGEAAGGDRNDVMQPGESLDITFDEPGSYLYYCSLHAPADGSAGMAGRLIVGDDEVAAGAGSDAADAVEWTGVTRLVPEDHPTIQNAVDAADPGDLVLVGPAPQTDEHRAEDGRYVYRETVEITTPSLTLRGTDRNEVIVDAEHVRDNAIATFGADGVVVENLTARNATGNGIYWTSVRGYRGSYLTAVNNGIYGIYAFDSTDGVFEHSYASGSADAGFYIGQCDPCDGVIRDSIAEWNGLGYSGTNASDVILVGSTWRHNVAGIVPNTLDSQRFPPHGNVTIVGNLIHDNDNRDAPSVGGIWPSHGAGVLIAGGHDSLVERNRIVNHTAHGVAISPNLSRNFWMSGGNVVRDNVIEGSGYSDVTISGPAMPDNCVGDNALSRTQPRGLQTIAGCGAGATAGAHAGPGDPDRGPLGLPFRTSLGPTLASVGLVAEVGLDRIPDVDHRILPHPPDQPQMPDGADAPVVPAVDVAANLDLDLAAYGVPALPDDVEVGRRGVVSVVGVPVGMGGLSTLYAVLGWIVPFGLLTVWAAMVVVDVVRREDLTPGAAAARVTGALVVPFVGTAVTLLVGRSSFPTWVRWSVVVGGSVVSVVLLGGAVVIGGVL
ncbi:MAG: right-handed parallel beta-helix repeat-containing protein [Nitriliruptoraceae bacterium]|nr:right-handed parallel beta-helix repeat-containing protein [Nitriliruptoraceae bacterium]